MSDLVIPRHTLHSQQRAADPFASAWVSANAGAGKTKVLTDRVLRLLLAGALPGRILCLTFTKAAAANMSIRVFDRLGHWVTMSDQDLEAELYKLEGKKPDQAQIRNARRLFARAIETPGGLKIETLHAFCERLLHLAPFEANVPARFKVLDENLAGELIEQMITETLADLASGREPELVAPWSIISARRTGDGLRSLIQAILRERDLATDKGFHRLCRRLAKVLNTNPDVTPVMMQEEILAAGIPVKRLEAIASQLAASAKPTDKERANAIRKALAARDTDQAYDTYHTIFFTQEGKRRSDRAFVTKSCPDDIRADLFAERDRFEVADDALKAAQAYRQTAALYKLASHIKQRIEREKMRLGALDFDDLVHKALGVLSRNDAAWVLYKLDRGIDHVLVDEAQDTNPEQWEILRLITADFTSGIGIERRTERTLFAVGDPKQSIYGFQGAAPHEFEMGRGYWSKQVMQAGKRFEDVRLTLSFRSVRSVLSAVDATFALTSNFRGLSFEDGVSCTVHESARPTAPGQVILWPIEKPRDEEEPEAWAIPLDQPEASSPPVIIARRIAETIARWMATGDETGRVWRAGDILILVRKRGVAFEAAIRALKERGVPVAGQDRIDIGSHIAVLDLIAAGRAALLPEDDLTLATALKSPLVGLSENDLFLLAADRLDNESLINAIIRHADAGSSAAHRARETLVHWRHIAKDLGPFGFYATLLGPMNGRTRLVGRLGTEAGDAIDAFLSFAQNAERAETPSLLTFLSRFDNASHSIKRDFESARDEVRVMTVHGAKGLEAPVTILIDGCDVYGRDPPLVSIPLKKKSVPVWVTKKEDCTITATARDASHAKALEEHHRLLYVAMTRARDKLLIAPFIPSAKRSILQDAWSEMIRGGLNAAPERLTVREESFGQTLIWQEEGVDTLALPDEQRPIHAKRQAPDWLMQPVAPEPDPLPPLRPSNALSAAQISPRNLHAPAHRAVEAKARQRGILAHTLIERLADIAPEQRRDRTIAFLKAQAPLWSQKERDRLRDDVMRLFDLPELAALFGETARAEVPIAGTLQTSGGMQPVLGQIDRFVVLDHDILLADFKTSTRSSKIKEAVPKNYILQLALYRELLAQLYPKHRIRPFIIWTSGPMVREITMEECVTALAGIKNNICEDG